MVVTETNLVSIISPAMLKTGNIENRIEHRKSILVIMVSPKVVAVRWIPGAFIILGPGVHREEGFQGVLVDAAQARPQPHA